MRPKVLLASGIAAPLLYAFADALAGTRWEGYSFRDQTISELGAIGAPSRVIFSVLLTLVYGLMVAFGVGVWQTASENRRLRAVGGLIVGVGVLALTIGQFAAMQQRGTEQGLAGAMHLVEGMVAMLLIFTSMGIAATVLGPRFRVYTIATILLALGFGVWSGLDAPRVAQGLPTPWVGVKERVFWYGYQSWYIVLALMLLRRPMALESPHQGARIPWFRRWGSAATDLARVMPGDDAVVDPTYSATLAVTVDARPEHIWPWLVQMGYQRGGLYSYDWLDRLFGYLDLPSADAILPQHQQLVVGDQIPIGRGGGFPVTAIDPYRALVLSGAGDGFAWAWAFGLYPIDETRTRLVSRNRVRVPRSIGSWLFMRAIEPAAFLMTRRMLLGLKQRAEALART